MRRKEDALLGIPAQRLAKRLCDCKEPYNPKNWDVNSFIAEYAEELRNTKAWNADFSGEVQKLYEERAVNWGQDGKRAVYKAVGCSKCNNWGCKGRVGLPGLLITDNAIKKLSQERPRVAEMFACAIETGKRSLNMNGMEKIMLDMTDPQQVRSVFIK